MFNPYADSTQTPFLEYNPNAIPEAYQEDMSKSPFQAAAPVEYDNQDIMKVNDGGPSPLERFWDLLRSNNGKYGIKTYEKKLKNGGYEMGGTTIAGTLSPFIRAASKNNKRSSFLGDIIIKYKPGDYNIFTGTKRTTSGYILIKGNDPRARHLSAALLEHLKPNGKPGYKFTAADIKAIDHPDPVKGESYLQKIGGYPNRVMDYIRTIHSKASSKPARPVHPDFYKKFGEYVDGASEE